MLCDGLYLPWAAGRWPPAAVTAAVVLSSGLHFPRCRAGVGLLPFWPERRNETDKEQIQLNVNVFPFFKITCTEGSVKLPLFGWALLSMS